MTSINRRTRELHAFAAQLETEGGKTRYVSSLTQTGLLAMLSTASAGVAGSDRARTRHLATLRDRLARFASALRSMADRGLLADDVVIFGNNLVQQAESLVSDFDVELKCVDSFMPIHEAQLITYFKAEPNRLRVAHQLQRAFVAYRHQAHDCRGTLPYLTLCALCVLCGSIPACNWRLILLLTNRGSRWRSTALPR